MNQTWRNEPRAFRQMRAAFRWAVWACVMYIGTHVLATIVQRITEG